MRIEIDLNDESAVELMLNFHNKLTNPSLSTDARAAFQAVFDQIADKLTQLRPNKADKINELRAELAELHQANHLLTRKGYQSSQAAEDQMRDIIR